MSRGKLFLVRHGESMGNAWKPAYKDDSRNFLTPMGVMQSQMVGAWFKRTGVHLDHLYSSNLTRARHTMACILYETDWQRSWLNLPSLNELRDGDDQDEQRRVQDAFTSIMSAWTEGNLLIVSHYHTMQTIFDCMQVDRKNIESHEGRHIGNAIPFVWDPEHDWCIKIADLNRLGDQN